MTYFDGNNGLKQVDYVVANGAEVPGPTNQYGFHDMEIGSYRVNPDCTGNAQINFPTPPHGTSGAVIMRYVCHWRWRTHDSHHREQPYTTQYQNARAGEHPQRRRAGGRLRAIIRG